MGVRKPIRIALTGMRGYAAELCQNLLLEMASPTPRAVLAGVCDRNPKRFPALHQRILSANVPVTSEFQNLLDSPDIDLLWLPLPIHLHREFTVRSLQAGKPVMIEKPAAGSIDDVDAMIAAEKQTGLPVAVGYQDIYQPAVQELKRRIVRGEFGIVLSASVLGCWPRSEKYFARNSWAGAISRDGKWVLDSPAQNAMGHYLNLALFLLGASDRESANPAEVEAELYRANEIENYDTCSMRLTFANGTHLLVALTHACQTAVNPEIVIRTQYARIRYIHDKQIEIHRANVSELIPLVRSRFTPTLDAICRWLSDDPQSTMVATLQMSRAHTLAINAASQASPIMNIPVQEIHRSADEKGESLIVVPGIEAALEATVRHDRMLHEIGAMKWSRPASDINLDGYHHFAGPADPEKKPGS